MRNVSRRRVVGLAVGLATILTGLAAIPVVAAGTQQEASITKEPWGTVNNPASHRTGWRSTSTP
jgi:hypothetical protein